jgi:GT2 family glycosyltransferase/glycosyltransferase involved in cell wall biosynthesis
LIVDEINRQTRLIRASELFDPDWYLVQYPDVSELQMDPIEHYVRWGARLGRDPSSNFDTTYYLRTNPDVRVAGLNPLFHYVSHGRREGRAPVPRTLAVSDFSVSIDVVVPVFNALADVKQCLESLQRRKDGYRVNAIIVNDGSDAETSAWLRDFCGKQSEFKLIEHDSNQGYTCAVNTGLRASTARYVITLNSDTIVTRGWLRGLVRCMASAPDVGIVGPLSNAASWQNVPDLYDESGMFAINGLPSGMSADDMASLVLRASVRQYPRTPFVNGFCFMIKRDVIDAIGLMDEDNFPLGYGEENDFCIRAAGAGFALAIADDSYVYHAKSKSFGHERRVELSRQGSESLKRKHTSTKFSQLVQQVKQTAAMDGVRGRINRAIANARGEADPVFDPMEMRVLFLLPVSGGGGGAHSVVQEVVAMRRLGLHANVAVKSGRVDSFMAQYKDVPDISSVFVGFSDADLMQIASSYDVIVGTIYSSMQLVGKICQANQHILPAYYVQDYETLFFPVGSKEWKIAHDSYSLVPSAVLFAKTHWIINTVGTEHHVRVQKVQPSIDHATYRPLSSPNDGRTHIAAMIRPQTPRRGAERTMRVFSRLARRHAGGVVFHLFGCDAENDDFLKLQRDFEFHQHGTLLRPEVASLLSRCDIFVDLSDYQAFGRTALEAMACGCAAMVPVHGGADEYARDGVNSLVVDSFDEDECVRRLDTIINSPSQLQRMRLEGLATAASYSVHGAAVSEWKILSQALASHRQIHPRPQTKLLLMPSVTKGGTITGSGYVRAVLPYCSEPFLDACPARIQPHGRLPAPGAAEAVLIQRDAPGVSLADLKDWIDGWRASGSRLIYEIDDDLLDLEALRARGYTGDVEELDTKINWLAVHADTITVSTEPLAKKLQRLNANVRVIPNRLDRDLWEIDRPRDHHSGPFSRDGHKIRIGYIGTPSHDKDLDVVADAINRIESEFAGRVEVEIIGGFELRKPIFGQRIGLPRKRDYPNFVKWLLQRVHWDIGIIPLVDDEFNRSKSHIKFLEYAALDMAIICSDASCYETVARHGNNSLVVPNETSAWYEAIKRLVVDAELRLELAASARELTASSCTIDQAASEYLDVVLQCASPERMASLAEPECSRTE